MTRLLGRGQNKVFVNSNHNTAPGHADQLGPEHFEKSPDGPPSTSIHCPASTAARQCGGAARVRGLVMKLFDKGDGDGANWRLCAESLFRVAFEALDRLPDDQKKTPRRARPCRRL
jgi:hypothetical protein